MGSMRRLTIGLSFALILLLSLVTTSCGNGDPDEDEAPTCDGGCDDGDPCTVDRCHPIGGHCLNALDPTCTKGCADDLDCAVDRDASPCVGATCEKGACRYLEVAESECTLCEDGACAGSFCDPRTCKGGFCRHAPRDCDDGDPHTWDRCSDADEACLHLLGDGLRPCGSDTECATDHACQTLTCQTGFCRTTPETTSCGSPLDLPRKCDPQLKNADCIQKGADSCVAGPCVDGFCRWREVPSPTCDHCLTDADCAGSFCAFATCTGTVCAVDAIPFCTDPDPATIDTCDEGVSACTHRFEAVPAICAGGAADDGDPATIDVCDTSSGETAHLPAAGAPCASTNRCWFTYEVDDGSTGGCLGHPVICNDGETCTAELCDPTKGCVYDDQECQCQTDADCDDGNPCSLTICLKGKAISGCWGTLLDACVPCTDDGHCSGDGYCVVGHCAEGGWCTFQDQISCDDDDPLTLGFCHGQRDDACTFEPADVLPAP